jgi:tRNA(His) 5'-end guanylyltransferase
MKPEELEARMRALEYFHAVRLLPGTWAILRVDGRGFTRFTERRFEKPFDPRFRDLMVTTARALMEELQALYAYTESDEISVLLPPEWDLFDREWEKAVSLSAAIASAAFTHACGAPAHFDSRVWLGAGDTLVIEYFRWRQADAGRCALNGWCYWSLRKSGSSVGEATSALEGRSFGDKNEILFQHGINFNDLPLWQRRGIGLYWEEYEKEGYNPITKQKVLATRRRIKVDDALPMRDDYERLLRRILERGTHRGDAEDAKAAERSHESE